MGKSGQSSVALHVSATAPDNTFSYNNVTARINMSLNALRHLCFSSSMPNLPCISLSQRWMIEPPQRARCTCTLCIVPFHGAPSPPSLQHILTNLFFLATSTTLPALAQLNSKGRDARCAPLPFALHQAQIFRKSCPSISPSLIAPRPLPLHTPQSLRAPPVALQSTDFGDFPDVVILGSGVKHRASLRCMHSQTSITTTQDPKHRKLMCDINENKIEAR